MIKIIVAGAAGRMGCRLVSLIKDSPALMLAGALESNGHQSLGKDAGEVAGSGHAGVLITDNLSSLMEQGDVLIDFSSPESTLKHMRTVVHHRRAIVVGTTGLSAVQLEEFKSLAGQVPCVISPNMSVGINLICKVIGEMARTLGEDYDIEVIEAHHRLKKDAPSGTALQIAEVLARSVNRDLNQVGVYARKGMIGERLKGEIGIQTIRAGDIVGDHTILFGGMGERIEVTHRASSRDTFAQGALRAAKWIVRQPPGLYDMMDVLGLCTSRLHV
jgi:4-hydroxy-tetrahydrodipicolinate reductase